MAAELTVALLDTSVVINLETLDPELLPAELSISALTLAELAAGPHAAPNAAERSARQQRLQWAEGTFDPLPFDTAAARAFGGIVAAVRAAGRQSSRRVVDLQIAAVATANGMPLLTRNAQDFRGLESLLDVYSI